MEKHFIPKADSVHVFHDLLLNGKILSKPTEVLAILNNKTYKPVIENFRQCDEIYLQYQEAMSQQRSTKESQDSIQRKYLRATMCHGYALCPSLAEGFMDCIKQSVAETDKDPNSFNGFHCIEIKYKLEHCMKNKIQHLLRISQIPSRFSS